MKNIFGKAFDPQLYIRGVGVWAGYTIAGMATTKIAPMLPFQNGSTYVWPIIEMVVAGLFGGRNFVSYIGTGVFAHGAVAIGNKILSPYVPAI